MPRKEFEMVVAQAPRKEYKTYYNDNFNADVPAGTTYAIEVFSLEGTISHVENLLVLVNAPAGTSGTHTFTLKGTDNNVGSFKMVNDFGKALLYNYQMVETAKSSQPSTESAQVEVIKRAFDSNIGVRLAWYNGTDADFLDRIKFAFGYIQEQISG